MNKGNKRLLGSRLPAEATTYGRQPLPLEAGSEEPRAHSCLGGRWHHPQQGGGALEMTPGLETPQGCGARGLHPTGPFSVPRGDLEGFTCSGTLR